MVTTGYDKQKNEFVDGLVEVEVLTVHFITKMMRVRYKADIWETGKDEVRVDNVPIDPFLAKYKIVEK
jgi:hypothetical protein